MLNGLAGSLEIAGGILLLFLSPHALGHLARTQTGHELSKAPHGLSARHLLPTSSHLTTSTTLSGTIYLLSHSIAKVALAALVPRDKLPAYPWLIARLLAFIACPLYRVTGVRFSAGRLARIRRRRTAC